MDAPTLPVSGDWLTREQIDEVLDRMSARDLIDALGEGETSLRGPRMIAVAFDRAAERVGLSNGISATDRVQASDFKYLADRMGEVVNVDNPKPDRSDL